MILRLLLYYQIIKITIIQIINNNLVINCKNEIFNNLDIYLVKFMIIYNI